MLTLPKNHPYRKACAEAEGKWMDTTLHPKIQQCCFREHHTAKRVARFYIPELFGDVTTKLLNSGRDLMAGSAMFTLSSKKRVLGVVAAFIIPDGDDPERVETGWFAMKIRGPQAFEEVIRKATEGIALGFTKNPKTTKFHRVKAGKWVPKT